MISRLSIRARLTAAFAAAMLVLLVLAGTFTYLKVRSDLTEALEESLASRADDVAALVSASRGSPPDLGRERLVDGEDSFAQVLTAAGAVRASTLSSEGVAAITPVEATGVTAGDPVTGERHVPGIDGQALILARSASMPSGDAVVVVGATTQDRSEALAGLTGAFAIGGPIAVLLASLLGYLLASRAFAPVEELRRRAAAITLERAGERLPVRPADDEIHRLAETLNEMLERIESSLQRERVFVADASHELRTPLAILRTELELARRPGRSPQELRDALQSTAEEVDRLSRLAENLLVIARADRGQLQIAREQVAVAALLERVRGRFSSRAAQEGREVVVSAKDDMRATLDPLRLEQALGNLVDNGLRHGAGAVRVSARRGDGGEGLLVTVTDDGDGFPGAIRSSAFERFSRGAESRGGEGAGLGLAIVRAVAEAHGGRVSLDPTAGRASTVVLEIPGAG